MTDYELGQIFVFIFYVFAFTIMGAAVAAGLLLCVTLPIELIFRVLRRLGFFHDGTRWSRLHRFMGLVSHWN